jgi:hypothetical protein
MKGAQPKREDQQIEEDNIRRGEIELEPDL